MSELSIKPFAYQTMVKPIGSACNLNCTYCYYLEKSKLYPEKTDTRMSFALLEKFISQYINAQPVPVIQFVWQGGEPTLLGLDYFKKILKLQQQYAGGKKIENAFQTNGTLLNDDWCSFFRENNFLVGISIDGPEEIHNLHRPFKTNKPSFSRVMNGIDLLNKHRVDFNTLTVVNRYNSKFPLEVYNFLKKIGSRYLQFIPIVERQYNSGDPSKLTLVGPDIVEAKVTDWSVLPEDYGDFLIAVFNDWVRKDVARHFVLQFDAALANWVGESPGICIFSAKCGDNSVLEHNGDVYSCDHYVYPEYKLGNILHKTLFEMMRSEKQADFGYNKSEGLPDYCRKCNYRFACHGECPKHRFEKTPDGEYGLNYLCKAYKKFYTHITPYMDFMAHELSQNRAPSNVMQWLAKNKVLSNK
jgi:uncharacterized protein